MLSVYKYFLIEADFPHPEEKQTIRRTLGKINPARVSILPKDFKKQKVDDQK